MTESADRCIAGTREELARLGRDPDLSPQHRGEAHAAFESLRSSGAPRVVCGRKFVEVTR